MGKSFFNEVIPFLEKTESDINEIEKNTVANFSFTKLDSTISGFRLLNLKNDWPFKPERDQYFLRSIHLRSYSDSLAYKVAFENYSWESAHTRLAERYYQQNNFREYGLEMRALFSQYTFKLSYADKAIFGFIKSGDYDSAYPLLIRRNKIESDDFSLKWLGSIYLMRGKNEEAIEFLEKSTGINSREPQAFFNLALAYYNLNLLNEAYNCISKCLSINPDYPNAFSLSEQIKNKRGF
jgi:tetratricopeptide (TPR) repeat protein